MWQIEYSIWPVLDGVVLSAEEALSLKSENNQNGSADGVAMTISRLVSCLEFIDACLLVRLEQQKKKTLIKHLYLFF